MDLNTFDLAIGAVVMPPIIAVTNQQKWSAQIKGVTALLICAVYALGTLALRSDPDFHDWRNTMLTTAGAAFGAYKLWWQPSKIAPAIESLTSVRKSPRPGDGSNADQTAQTSL
jgi:cyanate permease